MANSISHTRGREPGTGETRQIVEAPIPKES